MKKILLRFCLSTIGIFPFYASSQDHSTQIDKSPLRPENGVPYTFPSEEIKLEVSKMKIIELEKMIEENQNDPEKVKTYREMIWKYQHATISEVTGTN